MSRLTGVSFLQPFIEGTFVCENIPDWEDIFEVEEGSWPEFSSNETKLVGVDFRIACKLGCVTSRLANS